MVFDSSDGSGRSPPLAQSNNTLSIGGRTVSPPPEVATATLVMYCIAVVLNSYILLSLAFKRRHEMLVRMRLDKVMVFLVAVCLVWAMGAPLRWILVNMTGNQIVATNSGASNIAGNATSTDAGRIVELLDAPFASAVAIAVFGANIMLATERYFTIKRNVTAEQRNFAFYGTITGMVVVIFVVMGVFVKVLPASNGSSSPEQTTQNSADGFMPQSRVQASIWLGIMAICFSTAICVTSWLYLKTYIYSAEMLRMSLAEISIRAFQTAADMQSNRSVNNHSLNFSLANSAQTHATTPTTAKTTHDASLETSEEWEMNTLATPYTDEEDEYPVTQRRRHLRSPTTLPSTAADPLDDLERLEEAYIKAQRKVLLSCILMSSTLFLCYIPMAAYEFARSQLDLDTADPRNVAWYSVGSVCLSLDPLMSPALILFFRNDFRRALKAWKRRPEEEDALRRGAGGGVLRKSGQARPKSHQGSSFNGDDDDDDDGAREEGKPAFSRPEAAATASGSASSTIRNERIEV
ncbi:hypothetical protein BC830DRAFT_1078468 [Chytriomyces sp. MP71]|nr:hypothetical protein BC830DRAFT_1078468 [Chytriomyces sp. MP71]